MAAWVTCASAEEDVCFCSSPRLHSSPAEGAAIWLDKELLNGSSGHSATFDNEPLASASFKVSDIELWSFVPLYD
jgi:hypothetical protein